MTEYPRTWLSTFTGVYRVTRYRLTRHEALAQAWRDAWYYTGLLAWASRREDAA